MVRIAGGTCDRNSGADGRVEAGECCASQAGEKSLGLYFGGWFLERGRGGKWWYLEKVWLLVLL